MTQLIIIKKLMVCLAYMRSRGKMAVWAAGALAFPAAGAPPWAVPGYLQRRRRRLGIPLPASGLPSPRSVCATSRAGRGSVKRNSVL